jgi:hypothetical protein
MHFEWVDYRRTCEDRRNSAFGVRAIARHKINQANREKGVSSLGAVMPPDFLADAHKALAKQAEQRYQSRHRLSRVRLPRLHCFKGPVKPAAVAARA